MRIRDVMFFVLLLLAGCARPDVPSDGESGWYQVECMGCGTELMSTDEVPPDSCPNCPAEFCEVGGMLIMRWAGVHTNAAASAAVMRELEKHLEECEQCRNSREFRDKPRD